MPWNGTIWSSTNCLLFLYVCLIALSQQCSLQWNFQRCVYPNLYNVECIPDLEGEKNMCKMHQLLLETSCQWALIWLTSIQLIEFVCVLFVCVWWRNRSYQGSRKTKSVMTTMDTISTPPPKNLLCSPPPLHHAWNETESHPLQVKFLPLTFWYSE